MQARMVHISVALSVGVMMLSATHPLARAGRAMAIDDLIELEMLPEPESQPDIAELARVGPTHGFQVDSDEVGVVRRNDLIVVGKEPELPIFALLVVESNRLLPAAFLIVVELTEVCDDALPWAGLGANALDEGVVGVDLAGFGAQIASQEHGGLPALE